MTMKGVEALEHIEELYGGLKGEFMLYSEVNKTVYTTASVACGWAHWAGAVTLVKSPFGVNSHCVNDRRTDRVTHRAPVVCCWPEAVL